MREVYEVCAGGLGDGMDGVYKWGEARVSTVANA